MDGNRVDCGPFDHLELSFKHLPVTNSIERNRQRVSPHKIMLFFGLLFFLISACAGPLIKPEHNKGIYHRVRAGETLWSIAKAYHINLQELAELNNITNAAAIEVGDVIFIPGADQVIGPVPASDKRKSPQRKTVQPDIQTSSISKKIAKPGSGETVSDPATTGETTSTKDTKVKGPEIAIKPQEKNQRQQGQEPIELDKTRFTWPVKGVIVSRYGIQPNGSRNNGIKISSRENSPVLAAAAGEVTYADTMKYYGYTVILKHDNNYSTVYSSLKDQLVKVGDQVKQGQKIASLAKMNTTGDACLNFEIRQSNKPRNPLFFLP